MIAAIPTGLLLDSVATRLDPAVIGTKSLSLNLVFSDRSEAARLSVSNAVMVTEMGKSHPTPAATLTGPRMLFLGLLFQKAPLPQMEAAGLKVEGDRAVLERLLSAIEPVPANFNIVEP
jgi:alkyl sulfatase BDS1-like metallo-beta-lactamase superfamily hydrolase